MRSHVSLTPDRAKTKIGCKEKVMYRTSSKKRSLSPIHGEHTPGSQTDTLGEVNTTPEVHGQDTTTKIHAAKVKDSSIANVRKATEVFVVERSVNRFVEVAVVDFICLHARHSSGNFSKLVAEIFALLVCALGCCRQGSKFCVDLVEEFGEFVVV